MKHVGRLIIYELYEKCKCNIFNGICNLEYEVQSDSDNCMLEIPPCQLEFLQLKIMFKLPRRNTEQN